MDGRLEGWAVQEESPVGFGRFLPCVSLFFLLVVLSLFVACFSRQRAARRVLAVAEGRVDCSSEEAAALGKKESKLACFFMVNQTIPAEWQVGSLFSCRCSSQSIGRAIRGGFKFLFGRWVAWLALSGKLFDVV